MAKQRHFYGLNLTTRTYRRRRLFKMDRMP
jgi:hypothetical protein